MFMANFSQYLFTDLRCEFHEITSFEGAAVTLPQPAARPPSISTGNRRLDRQRAADLRFAETGSALPVTPHLVPPLKTSSALEVSPQLRPRGTEHSGDKPPGRFGRERGFRPKRRLPQAAHVFVAAARP